MLNRPPGTAHVVAYSRYIFCKQSRYMTLIYVYQVRSSWHASLNMNLRQYQCGMLTIDNNFDTHMMYMWTKQKLRRIFGARDMDNLTLASARFCSSDLQQYISTIFLVFVCVSNRKRHTKCRHPAPRCGLWVDSTIYSNISVLVRPPFCYRNEFEMVCADIALEWDESLQACIKYSWRGSTISLHIRLTGL